MANKKSSHDAYYPTSNLLGYSFLKTLQQSNSSLYNEAVTFFQNAKQELKRRDKEAPNVEYLLDLANHERAKEQKLINDLLPGQTFNLQDTGKYLEAINSFLTKKSIFFFFFSRIANIKKVKGKNGNKDSYKGGGAIDISTRFASFLRKRFDQLDFDNITFTELKKTVKQALIDMYTEVTREDAKLSSDSAYKELAETIKNSNAMVKDVLDLYFGADVISTLQDNPKPISRAEAEKFQAKFGGLMYYDHFKGNLEEYQHKLISDLVAKALQKAGLTQQTLHTGATGGQKADIINLINMNISPNYLNQLMEESLKNSREQSVRVKNADMWIELKNKLDQQGGHIIEVTDKNYSLTSESFLDNKGFTAQSDFRADHLERLLFKMEMNQENVGELMFVLANTGKQFIGTGKAENYEAAELFLATYIGFFMFDDLQVPDLTREVNTNYVHFMNLDGIFIPFSLFLFALYKSFINVTRSKDYQKYVNIKIKDTYTQTWKNNDNKLTPEDWSELYQDKLQATKIDAHFFGDFVNYIRKEYLNQSEI